jgi:DNA-binding LacI/PurR family transcriptional regulator
VARDRFAGYEEALAAVGLDVEPRLVVPGESSLLGGAQAMHVLVAMEEPPTAVFAVTDEIAIGALQVARDAGLRVPEDISVLGFDDHDVAEYVGLTTIRQDVEGQGERIAAWLIGRLAGERGDQDIQVHPTRLIVRRTTAAPLGGSGYRW